MRGRYVEFIKQTVAALPKPDPTVTKRGSKKSRRLVVPEVSDAQVAFFWLLAPFQRDFFLMFVRRSTI